MRTINPWAKAWANAVRSELSGSKAKARHNRRAKSGQEFLDGFHLYERTFSDIATGEMRVMNGRHAKELNDKLFDDYLVAMHKRKNGRALERWKVMDRFVEKPETL